MTRLERVATRAIGGGSHMVGVMDQRARGRCGSSATHPSGQAARQPPEVCPARDRGSSESSRARRSFLAERGSAYDRPGRCSREADSNARQHAASTESQSITDGGCSEGEIDGEGLTESVDKFALVLTNKDYQMTLVMSTGVFCDMDADSRLKAMRNKRTSERLNPLVVDHLRCAYVAVRASLAKKDRLRE